MCNHVMPGVFMVALTLASTAPATAQQTRSSVSGRVTDSSGAVLPGSLITVKNTATGVQLSAQANNGGNYRVDYLDPGTYELSASLSGFKTSSRLVEASVGEQLQIDIILEVGNVNENVTVSIATPLLSATNPNFGQEIGSRIINTVPLAQGNPTHLLSFSVGANPGTSASSFQNDEPGFSTASQFRFYGAGAGTISFNLNGINNSLSEFGGSLAGNVNPPADAVEEFKISHSYDATQGHNSGTSVDVSLKAGANAFHGSGYGFVRDSDLNANSFFNNRAGSPIPDSTYRRIGGSINGPVRIPRLYDGRDRTFFAFTYEDTYQQTMEEVGALTVPTPAQLGGDFSALLRLGPQYQIYDPLTTRSVGGGLVMRDPFPNNIIPANRISPIAKQLMQYWPAPNTAGGPDGSSNYQPHTPSPSSWNQVFVRIDHVFGVNNRIFGHYGFNHSVFNWMDLYDTLATGFHQTMTKRNVGLDYVHVASPNLLFNLQYGFTRAHDPRSAKSHGVFDIRTLGLSSRLISQLDLSQTSLPHIAISGNSGLHDATRNNLDIADSHTAQVQGIYNRGNHNMKLGFNYIASRLNAANNQFVMPSYQFGTDFTNGPLNTSPAAPLGQGLAGFLLGQPTGGVIWRRDNFATLDNYYSVFAQDNWRVTKNLTVNAGLRFEYYSPVTERYNRSVRGFDFDASSPIEAQARQAYAGRPIPEIAVDQFRVMGGLVFAGVGGQPRELYESPKSMIAPRAGFAYKIGDRSVLRGGYGIFYLPIGLSGAGAFSPIQTGYSQSTSLVPSLDQGVTFLANLENPFPNGLLAPRGADGGLATNLGQGVSFFNTDNLKAPYLERWSLHTQRELRGQILVEAGYVGTRGRRLIINRDLNTVPDRYLSTSPARDQAVINFLSQAVPNPFAGLLPGTALNGLTIPRNQLLKKFPQFQNVIINQTNDGYTWYHGLETKIEKRFSRGYMFSGGYTWSKAMEAMTRLNPSDPRPHETIAVIDRTHIVSLLGVWELPLGKGRRFWSNAPAGLSQVISGWEATTAWHAMSGFPITFPNLFFNGNIDDISLSSDQRTTDKWFNTDAGFVRESGQQPAFNVRTFPLRLSGVRTDGINFWDISLIKKTQVGKNSRIELHMNFLNAFNQTSFGAPNTNPASGSFGRVSSEMTLPRRIMFGLRFAF